MSPQNGKKGLYRKQEEYDFFKDNPFNDESEVSSKNTYRRDEFVLPTQKVATDVRSNFRLSPVMIVKQKNMKMVRRRSRFKLDSIVGKMKNKFIILFC